MSKETTVIVLGFLIALMPLLGFPSAWRAGFIMVCGVILMFIGFSLRSRALGHADRTKENPFVESIHQPSREQHEETGSQVG
ncbi:MAG TPA: hypothetical protein VF803_02305 [Candidatus Paceibacterota bacterium]